MTQLLASREATLASLRRLLCQASTEKTEKVLKQAGIETGEKKPAAPDAAKRKARGHGRNGAAAYRGARKVKVPHESLKTGARGLTERQLLLDRTAAHKKYEAEFANQAWQSDMLFGPWVVAQERGLRRSRIKQPVTNVATGQIQFQPRFLSSRPMLKTNDLTVSHRPV